MIDQPGDVGLIQGVEDRPCVLTAWVSALGKLVRKVRHEGLILLHELHNILDGELFEFRDVNALDVFPRG